MSHNDFWDIIYVDGDMDKDDFYGKWYENPKYVNEPPHVFVRREGSVNKPSDDMAVPMENPYKEYLLWTKSDGWFVGCYDKKKGVFYWTTHDLYGDETISPTYWLPMPDAPDT